MYVTNYHNQGGVYIKFYHAWTGKGVEYIVSDEDKYLEDWIKSNTLYIDSYWGYYLVGLDLIAFELKFGKNPEWWEVGTGF